MRVGVYVDGYNLYHGARGLCGRSTPGWRWLNLRGAVEEVIATRSRWRDTRIENVTYCTARISGASNPEGQREQDVHLRALAHTDSMTRISFGTYVTRVATAPLAVKGRNSRPVLVEPEWPILIQITAARTFRARRSAVPDQKTVAGVRRVPPSGPDSVCNVVDRENNSGLSYTWFWFLGGVLATFGVLALAGFMGGPDLILGLVLLAAGAITIVLGFMERHRGAPPR